MKLKTKRKLRERVRRAVLPEGFIGIAEFNDAKGRTQDEVLALFDSALARVGGVQ